MNQSPLNKFLFALQRKTGNEAIFIENEWVDYCPAHNSLLSKLTIRECKDGTVLPLCDEPSCNITNVCGVIGIEIRDLFPALGDLFLLFRKTNSMGRGGV